MLILSSAALLWQCAAEGGPTGGPVDTDGPILIRVEPPSGTTELEPDQDIVIFFNELVDPVSVPGSIVIHPDMVFTTRVRGRRIIIRSEEPYLPGHVYIITLQRGIRDYQKNSIPRSYQLVFSTGGEIPAGFILGHIMEFDPKRTVEVGLFQRTDTSRAYILLQSVGLATDGTFSFAYLPDGTYRLAAVEGGLGDFPASLRQRRYALPPIDSLTIKGDSMEVAMRLSPALAQPQIRSAEWQTPTSLALTFDTPFGDIPLPEHLYPTTSPDVYHYVLPAQAKTKDTLTIDLGYGFTQLGEPYRLESLAVAVPELIDTLPPILAPPLQSLRLTSLTDGGKPFAEARGLITFSEPVRIPEGLRAHLTGKDTADVPLRMDNPFTLSLTVPEPERYATMAVSGWAISDQAGNTMTDSSLQLRLEYVAPQATGQIRGIITGMSGRMVVEARDVETGRRVVYSIAETGEQSSERTPYFLDSVTPGFYTLFAHELIGTYPVPYYSGRWESYHRAARFSQRTGVVEVRPRWEVDRIDINFRAGILHTFPKERALNRE